MTLVSSIKRAVAVIFTYKDYFFMAKRQNFLKAFPGYMSFPGGKIEKNDNNQSLDFEHELIRPFKKYKGHMNAMLREIEEELFYSISQNIKQKNIEKISLVAKAITPKFGPHRFATYFYLIRLKKKTSFKVNKEELAEGHWITYKKFKEMYQTGGLLTVPSLCIILEKLYRRTKEPKNIVYQGTLDLGGNVKDRHLEINILQNFKQILVPSKTLPPAKVTNAFFLKGDRRQNVLIDPSPKTKKNLEKLIQNLRGLKLREIFITHHHPDHQQYAGDIASFFKIPLGMSQDTYNRLLTLRGKKFFKGSQVKIYQEGDILLNWLGSPVKVFSIPGHDEGQLGLAPKNKKWFLVGDLIQGIGTVVIKSPEGNMQKYFKSLKRVIQLNPKIIIPSHGVPLGGVHYLKEALNHRLKRESDILKAYSKGMTQIDQLRKEVYGHLKSHEIPLANFNIAAHLAKLKDERKI